MRLLQKSGQEVTQELQQIANRAPRGGNSYRYSRGGGRGRKRFSAYGGGSAKRSRR